MLKSTPEIPDDRANIVWTGENFTLRPEFIIIFSLQSRAQREAETTPYKVFNKMNRMTKIASLCLILQHYLSRKNKNKILSYILLTLWHWSRSVDAPGHHNRSDWAPLLYFNLIWQTNRPHLLAVPLSCGIPQGSILGQMLFSSCSRSLSGTSWSTPRTSQTRGPLSLFFFKNTSEYES